MPTSNMTAPAMIHARPPITSQVPSYELSIKSGSVFISADPLANKKLPPTIVPPPTIIKVVPAPIFFLALLR
jgi:hypothetical protein